MRYSQEFRNRAVELVLEQSRHAADIQQIVEDA